MDQNTLVERLFAATQAIEHAAAMADWPEAARLMKERAPLVHALSANQEPAALALIHRIRSIDAAVAKQAEHAQVELQVEYRAAMKQIQSTRQYHRIAML